jgi:hypothetical protein
MHTIRISDSVWAEIVKRGKFGETTDDVLRRVFKLPSADPSTRVEVAGGRRGRGNHRLATKLMRASAVEGKLIVEFDDGPSNSWPLPDKSDKEGIRTIRERAVAFALKNGATDPGQTNAVRKALTDGGYFVSR